MIISSISISHISSSALPTSISLVWLFRAILSILQTPNLYLWVFDSFFIIFLGSLPMNFYTFNIYVLTFRSRSSFLYSTSRATDSFFDIFPLALSALFQRIIENYSQYSFYFPSTIGLKSSLIHLKYLEKLQYLTLIFDKTTSKVGYSTFFLLTYPREWKGWSDRRISILLYSEFFLILLQISEKLTIGWSHTHNLWNQDPRLSWDFSSI